MFGSELVLAHVAEEPFIDEEAVEREAGDAAAFGFPAFQLAELLADEAECVWPLGEFGKIVDSLNKFVGADGVRSSE